MRQFFITSFERLMNVMVVLTGLAILALSGKMAADAQGSTELLLRALLVFLGGFCALFTVAGVAYLAIGNHQNLRRLTRLMETGGRAAKPLTASRSLDAPTRHMAEPALPEDEITPAEAPRPAPARFASTLYAPKVRRVPQASPLRAPEPGVAEQRQNAPEPAPVPAPAPAPARQEPRMSMAPRHIEPVVVEAAPEVTTEAYWAEEEPAYPQTTAAPAPDYEAQAHAATASLASSAPIFSAGMPKLRTPQAGAPMRNAMAAATGREEALAATEAAQHLQSGPAPQQAAPAMKSGRLVADRRPLR